MFVATGNFASLTLGQYRWQLTLFFRRVSLPLHLGKNPSRRIDQHEIGFASAGESSAVQVPTRPWTSPTSSDPFRLPRQTVSSRSLERYRECTNGQSWSISTKPAWSCSVRSSGLEYRYLLWIIIKVYWDCHEWKQCWNITLRIWRQIRTNIKTK